ncbi:ATP-binding protein [Ethanoligenens harbinense]|uniref:IstB ATP binding domain-containing protein n=1 Tax=Ethanoligenens harbinense (strain DSM 18485 / JCM 12961 / CGMCC 1.5033 / YUAN-3) TaxID=663278 RepID=E6U5J7_ETHHY|nr:ATP-binding protein [Ethanoligenens harbinense]ADU25664.1 IstB ATP binding domain-containing protein [Ethanoligenens harbinense YUAN-3]AVQ94840.1 ATP-binding protein [Ethanoligenens harbinense YUAN-3]AYF37531.1 ATP-binding protein [Ethanoligenens harbinense]AYF40251.1 ATP-binding protein [Ethanoligenens harbinense]QCN91086.1 AAA family ATPase [Ethanoligenens harbinense]
MEQAMKTGLESWFQPLPDKQCPFCGHMLRQLTHTVASGETYLLGIYETCTCAAAQSEQAAAMAAKAEAERKRVEDTRASTVHALMAASGIRGRYASRTLQTYAVPPGDERALKVALNYVLKFEEQREKGMGLYLYGTCGVGKTHLAYGVAHALIEQLHSVICRSATDILLELRGQMDGTANGTEYETMLRYLTCDLLVIDDLGKQQVTDWSMAQLSTIFDGRCQDMLPVIVTTNYSDAELIERLALRSDKKTAASIVSRLHEMTYDVPMSGQDYRSR